MLQFVYTSNFGHHQSIHKTASMFVQPSKAWDLFFWIIPNGMVPQLLLLTYSKLKKQREMLETWTYEVINYHSIPSFGELL